MNFLYGVPTWLLVPIWTSPADKVKFNVKNLARRFESIFLRNLMR